MTTSPTAPKRATLSSTGPGTRFSVEVDFNPTSLQYTVKNTFKNQGGNDKRKQNVSQSSAQLSMDLVFDSTDTGNDVRVKTSRIASMLKPVRKVPPTVVFEWGAYHFEGFVESHKETLDFFSHDGVPLRSAISLTLTQKETVFTIIGKADQAAKKKADPVEFQPTPVDDATSVASKGGDPTAGRKVAADNNSDSMRDTGDDSFLVDEDISIGAPVAFAAGAAGAGISAGAGASAGAGFAAEASAGASAGFGASASAGAEGSASASAEFGASASAGFGAGAGAEFGAGASAGFGASASAEFGASAGAAAGAGAAFGGAVGASASFGAGASAEFSADAGAITGAAFGSSASAGVAASSGAFAGLRVPKVTKTASFDIEQLIETSESVSFNTETGASFEVGGQARVESGTGFRTNVDAQTSLTSRIEFED